MTPEAPLAFTNAASNNINHFESRESSRSGSVTVEAKPEPESSDAVSETEAGVTYVAVIPLTSCFSLYPSASQQNSNFSELHIACNPTVETPEDTATGAHKVTLRRRLILQTRQLNLKALVEEQSFRQVHIDK